jgi:hypothetical protein
MRELKVDEISSVTGGIHIHIPNLNNLISTVLFGAIGGALSGIAGGPIGTAAGALAGAAIAGAGVATYDAMEIKDSLNDATIANNG